MTVRMVVRKPLTQTLKLMFAVAAVVWSSAPAAADELLTMESAVQIALERNTALAGALHDRDAARWGRWNAVTNFLPRVELTGGITRIDPASERRANAAIDFIKAAAGGLGIPQAALSEIKPFAYRDTYATDLLVVQPIYNGGAELVGLRAANASEDRSIFALEDTEQDVIARVRTAYCNTLKAQELVVLSREAVARTRRHLDVTMRRADMGMRTKTDVLRWEVQLAADEGNLVNAENGLAALRLQLNEVMGVPLDAGYTLEPVVSPDSAVLFAGTRVSAAPLASLTSLSELPSVGLDVIEDHPSMKIMQANLRLADAGIDQAWVNFKPRVNLAFQYGWEKNNTLRLDGITPWALSLQVSVPIFNSFGDFTNLQKARAEYQRAETQVESFRRGLQVQAAGAELNLRAARKRIEIARKAQEEADDVLTAVTRRYETGGASNVDVIDVQTAYTSAKANYITAVYDYYIAEIQRARALGKIRS